VLRVPVVFPPRDAARPTMSSSLLSMTRTAEDSPQAPGELAALREIIDEITRERDQLLTVVDLQQELARSLQVADVLQRITRRLGDLLGLDRSSIYLAGEGSDEVRLVATLKNPELRNLLVDITRYPELAHAFSSARADRLRRFSATAAVPLRVERRPALVGNAASARIGR